MPMPPAPANTMNLNRYVQLPDGSYKDTMTGQVVAQLPPGATNPSAMGAIGDLLPKGSITGQDVQKFFTPGGGLNRSSGALVLADPSQGAPQSQGAIAAPAAVTTSPLPPPAITAPPITAQTSSGAPVDQGSSASPMGALSPSVMMDASSAPAIGALAGSNAVSPIPSAGALPQVGASAGPATPPTTPVAGGIDRGAIDTALAAHPAPDAVPGPMTPIAMTGGIDKKSIQDSLPTAADYTADPSKYQGQMASPVTHEGDWLQQLGGKLGLGDGTSTDSSTEEKDRNMALMRTGLAMMAAGGQPGATPLGALGQGGLYAMTEADKEKDREEAKQWREKTFSAEQANKAATINLDLLKYLTGSKQEDKKIAQKDTEIGQTGRHLDIEDKTATATVNWRNSEVADSGKSLAIRQQNADSETKANATRDKQLTETQTNHSHEWLNQMEQRAQQDLTNRKRALATEIDPAKRAQIEATAEPATAQVYPESAIGRNYGTKQLRVFQQAYHEATQKGDATAAKKAQDGMAQVMAHYFPNVKEPPE